MTPLTYFCAGYSFDRLDDGPANEYSMAVKSLMFVTRGLSPLGASSFISYSPNIFRLAALRRLTPFLVRLGPPGFRRFIMKLVPNKTVRRTQDIVDIMDRTSVELFQRKKLALQQGDEAVLAQVGRGKDIMSILCMYQFLTSFRTFWC